LPTVAEALEIAFDQLTRARWVEAEATARAILAAAPDVAGAWWAAGVALAERERPGEAISRFEVAITLAPGGAGHWRGLANVLIRVGDTGRASRVIERGTRLDPESIEAWVITATARGRSDAARLAVALAPDDARGWSAAARAETRRPEIALSAAKRAATLSPRDPSVLAALGNAALAAGLEREGETLLRRVWSTAPSVPGVAADLASTLARAGRMEEAEEVLAAAPDTPETWNARAAARRLAGRFRDAEVDYDRVIRARPTDRGARWNRALVRLSLGRWLDAWAGFEERVVPTRGLPRPTGRDDLPGRTLLLTAEQGLGDTLHFIRYTPLFARAGARVVVEIPPELAPLYPRVPGADRVVVRGEAVSDADMECPMMSGPALFGSTPDEVPPPIVPHVDPARRAAWRERLGEGDGPRVGLVWAGNPRFQHDRARSPGWEAMRPLLAVEGVRFVALQFGPGRARIDGPSSLVDLGPEIRDFADTAAIMSELDLVISSCTAPAHLAGSLGRPLWLWLSAAPDWRWLTEREDSPWYGNARLFRQPRLGDWNSVAERSAIALRERARGYF